jgi:DNA polymerase I-like protein with 3'-5' exonuclease and polymerase domains
MKDTEFTLRLYEVFKPMVAAQGTDELYSTEVQTALALLDIEANGIGLDVPYLEDTASLYGKKVMRGMLTLEKLTADESVPKGERKAFNPNSPKQITEAFERLGVDVSSTDKAALGVVTESSNEAAAKLAQVLLQYRKDKKLHSTYLVGMLDEQRDGILHPNFNLTLPRTGRMSSSGATNN